MSSTLTRRSLVAGAATAAVSTLAAGGVTTALAQTADITFADTIAWNAEYDVVVVGYGTAGGTAAIYAADNGARVLLCDCAPEGEEGGNSRVACQMMVAGNDPDKMFKYYKDGLFWHFNSDEETLRTYTDALCNMESYMEYLGVPKEDLFCWPNGTVITPEYPEYEGGDAVYEVFVHQGNYDSALYKLVRKNVIERADSIDVWCSSAAQHLVQDPQTKTIVGVELERDGQPFYVHANNGVVLACGGFENNTEMLQDYLGIARAMPIGCMYNNGDGVRMGIEVGAAQWHMEAYESLGILNGNALANDETGRAVMEQSFSEKRSVSCISLGSEEWGQGSVILVGDDGDRFSDETCVHRHGHVYSNGVWRMPVANWSPWLIFDQAELDWWKEVGRITPEREELIVSASSPEELAEKTGVKPEILARTLDDFNFFAENGRDYKYNRPADSMRAFEGDTLYALQFRPAILNPQGGPRRNGNAEVLDTLGNPIPHLYSAGELGGICAFQYNSGGNLAECVIFGSIAGTNAAAAKDPLPNIELPQAAEADIKLTPGDVNDSLVETTAELADNQRLGRSTAGMGNELVLRVTLDGETVTDVEVIKQSETPDYGGKALPKLIEMAVASGTDDVDVVAGVTMTSAAFMDAMSDALK